MTVNCPIATRHARRTAASTLTKRERATFYRKSAHILSGRGYSNTHIADILKISERSIRAYLAAPCRELEAERDADAARIRGMKDRNVERSDWQFCQPDDFLTEGETLRSEIRYLQSQGMNNAEIARQMGMSRQRVQYHTGRKGTRGKLDRTPASLAYASACDASTAVTLALCVALVSRVPWSCGG